MTPRLPRTGRLALLGCAALAAAAMALGGCGSDGEATAQGERAAGATANGDDRQATKPRPADGAPAVNCPAQLDRFVEALDRTRSQLAVGLSYEQYAAAVKGLRSRYAAIPVDRLPLDCLAATGTTSERALNEYIDGVNAWGECLADASCTTAAIEPVLQRKWRAASHLLGEAG